MNRITFKAMLDAIAKIINNIIVAVRESVESVITWTNTYGEGVLNFIRLAQTIYSVVKPVVAVA